jgi:riboflavin biosynthesis pyrimidine reductase
MRVLVPEASPDPDLHEFYARDWVGSGGVRVNFIASADGAVSAGGRSAGLQTPGDNRVFAALRDLADVVLVGARTAQTEGYGPVHPAGERLAKRRRFSLPDALPIAIMSRSLHVDPAAPLFTEATGATRTIVLTCAAGDADVRRQLDSTADVVVCGDDDLDLAAAIAALRERGHTRLLCEGGPSLFASLAGAGLVDELCLSLSPLLVGPGPGRITGGAEWAEPHSLTLAALLEEDGALFCRYRAG